METIYDWTSLVLFSFLAFIFLSRSFGPAIPGDKAIAYLAPAFGCGVADRLGNAGHAIWASLTLVATFIYMLLILKAWNAIR